MNTISTNSIPTQLLRSVFLFPILLLLASCSDKQPTWKSIFNGKDLQGWTVKTCGAPAGENYKNIVRVEDGLLRMDYSEFETFSNQYTHVFYEEKLSHFRLRLEYRLHSERVPGGKHFTELNSGVMFHSQSAESMEVDQEFPVSVEAQFLACHNREECDRTTMNIASPGTHVTLLDGELRKNHMTYTKHPAPLRDEWLAVEIEVRGNELVHHKINGEIVLSYTNPQIGGTNHRPDNFPLPEGTPLESGYIALQGESHPIDFRNIELMILPTE
ncbi:3-keto-disaccharide hydrolase [Pelagicoccus mobilis]|uniref:DUF1080 domain-containing protein n=1 Tax=Pelagicoccus mobilis TaxID=415221 RepID=A0A934S5Y7_9BACT|nr:DUF1080 domain-containing protein [Pelagicoccus mobilis]MBK1879558.1 DUF1080 domain-containing protein [Pelagicoccus mobilis]